MIWSSNFDVISRKNTNVDYGDYGIDFKYKTLPVTLGIELRILSSYLCHKSWTMTRHIGE